MPFSLAFERSYRVLRAKADGVIATQDLLDLDGELIAFLAREEAPALPTIRGLYDFSKVAAFAIPQTRAAERGSRPSILRGQRVIIQSSTMACGLLDTFTQGSRQAGDTPLSVVASVNEAHELLGMAKPHFEDVG